MGLLHFSSMATHSLYPPLTSFSPPKPFIFPCLPLIRYPLQRRFPLCASSIKKPRARRKVKSDQELCNDIREFVSAVGLPEGHLPSMKELSQHGRTDLANIVRRRGYKHIKDLLSSATKTDTNEFDVGESLTENQDATSDYEDESTGQDEKAKDLVEDVPLSSKGSIMESGVTNANIDPSFNNDEQSCIRESSTHSSFQEKVAKFIQNGELDTIEDNDYGILSGAAAEEGKGVIDSENTIELESRPLAELHVEHASSGSNAAKILNGSTLFSDQIVPPVTRNDPLGDDRFSSEGLISADFDNLGIETNEGENQVEVNHLKLMLHQKELELSQLKKQIEKEKLALTILQTKAETEISKAQKIVLEKDAELNAAEESLSGLKEVMHIVFLD
ncbi:protein PTST homolog 3, chloroplastic isoform X3 [Vitis vinifera]|uniref:protein PTST homolog 3, chloroplastic isoform X3 n=1 Tax=Vitis vinifera TaxID=29760 RepID=UPI00053F63E9|nr:protein PTST homolog 3, chloroplastic isoform X3 [Vitis vinifera]|eukprot:XP_010653982.1 PREDICTED: uncharacterized protein LOC100250241 isoform X3 [Vitis vinifera]